jgi:hypothetical protein
MHNFTELKKLKTPKDYILDGRTHIFPSEASIMWFIRKNKQQLIDTHVILRLAGRTLVDVEALDKMVRQIGIQSVQGESHV